MSEGWSYNLIIYLYLLGVCFSTSHFISLNHRLRRFSIQLMWCVWGLQTTLIILWLFEWTLLVIYVDAIFIFAWILVTLYLFLSRFPHLDILLYVMQLIGLFVMIPFVFYLKKTSSMMEQLLLSEWIFSHVLIAVAAYAFFFMSSICAALYLVENYLLKQRKWNHLLRRLPSLTELESLSDRLVKVGVVLLSIAIFQGMFLAYPTMKWSVLMDPKIWGSFWVFSMYAICFILRRISCWMGSRLAWWNFISVGTLIINYFLINSAISFHHWI